MAWYGVLVVCKHLQILLGVFQIFHINKYTRALEAAGNSRKKRKIKTQLEKKQIKAGKEIQEYVPWFVFFYNNELTGRKEKKTRRKNNKIFVVFVVVASVYIIYKLKLSQRLAYFLSNFLFWETVASADFRLF